MRAIRDDTDVIEGQAEDVSALQNHIDDEEAKILEDFGAAENKAKWKIKIYKVGDGPGRGHVKDISPSELPYLEKLRALAGPGSYQAWCYNGQSKTPKHVLKWEIAELLPAASNIPSASESALAQLVAGVMATQKDLVREIASMKAAPAVASAPPSSMSDMMLGFSAMMKEVRALNPPQVLPPQQKPVDQFEMFQNVVGLVKELGSADREKSMLEIVMEGLTSGAFGDLIKGMQQQQAQPQLAAPVPRPALPGQPPRQPAPGQQPAPAPAGVVHPFASQIEILLTGAQQNIDPGSYADVVGASVDKATLDQILAIPDPVQMLVMINPNIEPYREWFRDFFDLLTEEPQVADIPKRDATRRDSPAVNADVHSQRGGGGEDDSEIDEDES